MSNRLFAVRRNATSKDPQPGRVIVASTGRHVFVTNALSNSISIIDAKGNKVIRTINLKAQHPLGLALVANGSLLR